MKLKIVLSLLAVGVLSALWLSCEYDHGVDPIRTKIKGSVIFTGAFPQNVIGFRSEARLVIVKKLPPENLTTDVISEPLPFNRFKDPSVNDTVNYELLVEPGVYPIAGILFRPSGEALNIANIMGLYLKITPNFTIDTRIEVNEPPGVEGVNIFANWDLARRDAAISGTINFKGPWRHDTNFFVLACYSNIPKNSLEFFTEWILAGKAAFQLIFQSTPVNSLPYTVRVNSQLGDSTAFGKYKFTSLFWIGKNTSLADIRAIGFYRCDGDSTLPRFAATVKDSTTSGIDFSADFSKLPAGVNYRKDGAPCPQ
jgi:hypothetical protein